MEFLILGAILPGGVHHEVKVFHLFFYSSDSRSKLCYPPIAKRLSLTAFLLHGGICGFEPVTSALSRQRSKPRLQICEAYWIRTSGLCPVKAAL